ncbi:hypothetical protein Bbelb_314950 [Branchiostoma belcheri]|nr:hypothetical protein Bbelb_314950 [Branchiostoma belcheri]
MDNIISSPTRVTDTSSTSIDVILTNDKTHLHNQGTYEGGFSDHAMIYTYHRSKGPRSQSTVMSRRVYKSFNEEKFRHDLAQVPWKTIDTLPTINEQLEVWEDFVSSVATIHAPIKKVKIRGTPAPWLTKDLRHLIGLRDHMYRQAKRSGNSEDFTSYKTMKNRVNYLCRIAKKDNAAQSIIQGAEEGQTGIWKAIRKLLPSKSPNTITCLEYDGQSTSDKQGMTGILNTFFHKVIEDLYESLSVTLSPFSPVQFVEKATSTFAFSPITVEFVTEQLSQVKLKKATGLDNIDNRLLKVGAQILAPSLTKLFNKSLDTGEFPTKWKQAKITPIYKKGDKTSPSNYRPVSRSTGDANVINKKQRTEDDNEARPQHIQNSNGGESGTVSQLVPYQNSNSLAMYTQPFECEKMCKARLHFLMVQNICNRCTALSSVSSQLERTIHMIFVDEEAADSFVAPISVSGFIHINKSRDTYVFSGAKNCIVTVSWIHDLDDDDAADVYIRELEQMSNGREPFFVLTLPGQVTSRSTIQNGQVVPIGSLSFSSCGESRTSLAESRPTFNTQPKCNAELNALLQACTRKDVLHKHPPRAVCIDKHVPFSKTYVRSYGVVMDKHPTFVRTLVDRFGARQQLCVMVEITKHVDHDGDSDQKTMQNANTVLHTFLAAGIDTVFPEVGPIPTTCDLVRRQQTESACSQREPINRATNNHAIKFTSRTTYQLPETPDSNRQVCTTKDISPSVEPALDSSKPLTDILLLEVAKKLPASDAIDLGVALGQERIKAKNLVDTCGQQSAAAVQEVLHAWKSAAGKRPPQRC